MIVLCAEHCFAQTDSTGNEKEVKVEKVKEAKFTYFRMGVDLSKILASSLNEKYKTLEFQVDAHYKKNLFLATEFGFGTSTVQNDFIAYKSKNSFMRFGIDKTFFSKEFPGDLDNAFVGLRYGIAFVKRDEATYTIYDKIWGNFTGVIDASSFVAHWLELTGGFRMEIIKNIFAGWNVRLKTFINPSTFEKLPPAYISGYGRGDKNTAFGYNFYLLYGFGKKR